MNAKFNLMQKNDDRDFKSYLYSQFPTMAKIKQWLSHKENQQLVALLLVAFLIRIWRIAIPEEMNFDEEYYIPVARDYLNGITDPVFESSHPPMGHFFLSLGISLFGYNQFGWRIMPVLFGTGTVALIYFFGKALFNKHAPAIIAAFLLSFDFLHFTHSRLGMLDMFSVFFNILSYYMLFLYIKKDRDYYLWIMSASLALGAACKWTTLFTIAGVLTIFLACWIYRWIFKKNIKFSGNTSEANPVRVLLLLIVIPVLFQFLVFIPLTGTVGETVEKLKDMVFYHRTLTEKDDISSPWWSWSFVLEPIPYSVVDAAPDPLPENIDPDEIENLVQKTAVMGMGNPLVWWLMIPAFIMSMILAYKNRIPGLVFSCLLFLFQYLPWAFANRITYIFYFLDAVPYLCLFLGFCLYWFYNKSKTGKMLVTGYLSLVVLSFIVFYPILSCWIMKMKFFNLYRDFGPWKFNF